MAKKKRKVKPRNPNAKALESPIFRSRILPKSKKQKLEDLARDIERDLDE